MPIARCDITRVTYYLNSEFRSFCKFIVFMLPTKTMIWYSALIRKMNHRCISAQESCYIMFVEFNKHAITVAVERKKLQKKTLS